MNAPLFFVKADISQVVTGSRYWSGTSSLCKWLVHSLQDTVPSLWPAAALCGSAIQTASPREWVHLINALLSGALTYTSTEKACSLFGN